ncbi:MAG TPA: hypothetical protein VG867_03975 [Rhizomicrobium sp.]|nr:hypothetical protein [Rhizomicrobium sp.]
MTILESAETVSQSGERAAEGPTLAVCVIALFAFAWHAMLPLNHDVAWIWEGAGRLLDGARFGDGVIDVNPPLAWWITILPVLFARATHLSAAVSFAAFLCALSAASILLSLRMWAASRITRWCLALFAAWALLIVPGYDFGQREHLMAVLALPYIGAVIARVQGEAPSRGLLWCAGVLGGLGFCLKPYFFFIPLVLELWLCLRRRRIDVFRIEIVAIALVAIVYLCAVFFLAPDYLHRVVPDAVAGYGAYAAPFGDTVIGLATRLVPVLVGCGFLILADPVRKIPVPAQAFLAASFGAGLACLIQSKDWAYQMFPALGFAAIVAGALIPRANAKGLAALGALVVLVPLSLPAISQWIDSDGTRARVAALSSVFSEKPDETVFAFITSPRDIHPAVVDSGARWIAPACCLHLLPAAVEKASPAAIAAGERQAQQIVTLLIGARPQIVAVDDNAAKLGFNGRFDYLAYFKHDPRFVRFWTGYREGARAGGFRIFRCTVGCSGNVG